MQIAGWQQMPYKAVLLNLLINLYIYKMSKPEANEQSKSRQRKGRIILRNLVFDVNEKMLRGLCSKFGSIVDVS